MQQYSEILQKPRSKKWIGIALIAAGALLTANRLNAGVPDWLVGFPAALVAGGLLLGFYNRFSRLYWIIPVFWGAYLMVEQAMPELGLHQYTTAVSFIAMGIIFITLHRLPAFHAKKSASNVSTANNVTNILSHVKRSINTSDYPGSNMVCVLGNVELDLTGAFINDEAEIDITIVMGASTLAIPAHWVVKNEMSAVLGVVADKRPAQASGIQPTIKTLVLKGAVILGNIDITNRL